MPNFNRKTLVFTVKICIDDLDPPPPPPPPPPPSPENHSLSPFIIFMFCCLAATFSSVCYIAIIKACRAFRNRSRMRSHGNANETHQDFIDEEHGSIVFHPIWLINTIGLDQSAIDSIKVFKYRKGDGLIDGTDCAVCLGEFQDEESLRLLPNCSHAFHVSCIDTWLRSHKNCPVCRALVVNTTTNARLESNPIEEEIPNGNLGNQSRRGQNPQEIDGNGESLEQKTFFVDGSSSGVRVQSDLTDRRLQEQLQPVRRSVSMDSFSAAASNQEKKPNGLQKSTKRRGLPSSISICSIG